MRRLYPALSSSSHLLHPGPYFKARFKRSKYILRGMARRQLTLRWFKFLATYGLDQVATEHPYFYRKLQIGYLTRTLSPDGRLQVLEQHYRFLQRHLSPENTKALFSKGILLAFFETKKADALELRLLYSGWCPREGELMIQLMDARSGLLVSSISFTVGKYSAPRHEIFIGGLQGRNGNYLANPEGKDSVVEITRGLHGLRPKALLLFAVQQVCSQWGISSLRAVSNRTHVHRHSSGQQKLLASYDAFWSESGGLRLADGNFTLPARFVPREECTIAPKKRSLYRSRYQMMETIGRQIHESLGACAVSLSSKQPSKRAHPSFASLPKAPVFRRDFVLNKLFQQRQRSTPERGCLAAKD